MSTLHAKNFSANQMKQKIDDIATTLTDYSDDKKKQFESTLEQMMISMDEQIDRNQSEPTALPVGGFHSP